MTFLTLWTTLAPWQWERVPGAGEDTFRRPAQSYGICTSGDKATLSKIFGSFLAVVDFIPMILSVYQSYRSRGLPSEFNESRYLALSLASLLETFLIGLPIILMTVLPTAVFLSRAVLLCMSCLAVLMPMFVPKWLNMDGPSPPPRRLSITPRVTEHAIIPNSG